MIRIESSTSAFAHGPNIMVPRASGLTSTPVRPSWRYSMVSSPCPRVSPGTAATLGRSQTAKGGRTVPPSVGGADAQVTGHVAGNLHVGNTRQQLLDVLTVLVPVIGYPRTLNGLAAVNEGAPAD
ncbi:carboxymuconolactone decarboxylase family protein [Curtobacterium sp. PvP017]